MSRCRCQTEARPAAVHVPEPGADLAVVVVAAGSGERFGHPGGKALVEVAGRPLVAWSLLAADAAPSVAALVLVCRPGDLPAMEALVAGLPLALPVTVVPGGEDRQASCAAGLGAVSSEVPLVAFHDGARPLVRPHADFDASLDMTGLLLGSTAESAPITLDGTLEGVMAGGAKMDAAMGLTMDLRPFLKALTDGQNGGMSASDTELLDALAEEGIHMELRGDLEAGQLYISLGGAFLEQAAGLPADTWYSMDMSAIYEDMGLDYGALMEMTTGDVDYTALLSLLLSTVEPNDKDTAYSELTQAVDLAAQLLRDDAWAVSGNDRILHYALEQDGVAADFTFTLTMRGDDVSAYDLSVELSADVDGSAPMSIFLQESMDADGRMEASMQCDAAGLMDLEFSMSGRYTEGKTAPETEPPKGAVVVDLTAPEAPADPVPTSGDPAEVVIDKIYTTGGGFIGVTEG